MSGSGPRWVRIGYASAIGTVVAPVIVILLITVWGMSADLFKNPEQLLILFLLVPASIGDSLPQLLIGSVFIGLTAGYGYSTLVHNYNLNFLFDVLFALVVSSVGASISAPTLYPALPFYQMGSWVPYAVLFLSTIGACWIYRGMTGLPLPLRRPLSTLGEV